MRTHLASVVLLMLSASTAQSTSIAPIDFKAALAPPSAKEIAQAEQAWATKRRHISQIRQAGRTRLVLPNVRYGVQGFTYSLNGSPRCGAVLIPEGRVTTSLVDLSDIRWDYPPRDISRGPFIATTILADRAKEAALIIPCLNGMTLKINDLVLTSGGDRRDAWEGATEDARAFLTVALKAVPQLPQHNIVAYGGSRGGGVALLFGEREPRVRRVTGFAAPTDFFSAMGRPGADWPAELAAGAHDPKLRPDSRERQYLDWFVDVTPHRSMSEIRHKLLMSSAAYFLKHLPETQVHQGKEDVSVFPANAQLVADWASSHPRSKVQVFIYPGQTHYLMLPSAFATARKFLLDR